MHILLYTNPPKLCFIWWTCPAYGYIKSRDGKLCLLISSSALHLYVWLSNDDYLQIIYLNQSFLLTIRAVYQNSILSNSIAGLGSTYLADYPFVFQHYLSSLTFCSEISEHSRSFSNRYSKICSKSLFRT